MKRIAYQSYGGPEVMHVEDFTPRAPGPNDVVVTVKAASINPIDWKIRLGYMRQFSGEAFPRGLGSEFAGVISGVGSDVVDFHAGDEVVGATTMDTQGAFAEAAVTTERMLAKKPAELSFVDATGVALAGVTAWLALVKTADLRSGQRLLVNGALGGVGQAAATLAKSLGAHVVGRVSAAGLDEGKALGLDEVLDYAEPVAASRDGTFDVVFDVNGSLSVAEGDALVKQGGVVVDINPTDEKVAALQTSAHRKLVIAEGTRANLETVLDLAAKGQLRSRVNQRVPFDHAIATITALEAGRRVSGKTVITFP